MDKLLKRKEVPVENTWALEDIFPTEGDWEAGVKELAALTEEIGAYRGKLGESGETLLGWYRLQEKISLLCDSVLNYAFRLSDTDNGNGHWLNMRGRATTLAVNLDTAMSFAAPEIMGIPEEKLREFYEQCPELRTYERALYCLRRLSDHILSPAEETLLSAAGEMAQSPDNIGNMLRDADMTFPKVLDGEGKEHLLTQGTYGLLMQSSDRTLRENTFRTLYKTYGGTKNTAAAILNAQMKQLKFFSDARRYPDALSAALTPNEVPVEVYYNLLGTVEANIGKLHRYMGLRKRIMGLEELHMYDVYSPMIADADEKLTYAQAGELMLKALAPLGEDYLAVVRRALKERWIDVYENEGKTSGAYSSGARPHPYILLNHRDDLDSAFTLVHEMGHAMHSYLSMEHQRVIYSDYVIFVAEVASICNEVLLMQYLLGQTEDKRRRAYLINHFLEQFRTTLYRQTQFARFELDMSGMCARDETLTAESLSERYLELNRFYYGDDVISDEEIALEWARIPHFFYDFYVFQYATGFSAAIAIAMKILAGEPGAVGNYKKFLSSGCSRDPISLLRIAGVDMASPEPVQSALDYFDRLLDEMEELV